MNFVHLLFCILFDIDIDVYRTWWGTQIVFDHRQVSGVCAALLAQKARPAARSVGIMPEPSRRVVSAERDDVDVARCRKNTLKWAK